MDKCPVCQSANITSDDMDYETGIILDRIRCEDCNAEWTEIYHFTDYQIDDYGDKYEELVNGEVSTDESLGQGVAVSQE
jgi:C4-type Zn-finger protein